MSFHVVISRPRKATHNRYTVCEIERNKKGDVMRSKLITYADTNDEAKNLARSYRAFHFIDSTIYANGKES